MSPNPATGASIVMENYSLLDIPMNITTNVLASQTKRTRELRSPSTSQVDATIGRNHSRQVSSPVGISEMLARGLVERGESLGINKTLMNAVTEIRRNIPELAATLGVRTPNQQLSSFQLVDERPVEERPPWEPRTRFEMERDISQYRSRDKTLGESLAWIVDALLQDESEYRDVQKVKLQKREALESLSYVRDVLMTNLMVLDDDRLIGGEEKERRRAKSQKENDDLQAASASAVVAPPAPVPVAVSQAKKTTHRVRPRSPAPLPSSVLRPNEDLSQRAPWNHTGSNFSTPTSMVPAGLLPRPPPPTSTSLRREGKQPRDQTTEGYQDPLGALR